MRARIAGGSMALVLALLIPMPESAREQAREPLRYDPAKAARANELLDQARIAAGGKEELQSVSSLAVSMRVRRFVRYLAVVSPVSTVQKDKILKGSLSVEIQMPDKFRKHVSSTTLLGHRYSYVEVVNGERAWREPPLQAVSSNRDQRLIDVADFERSLAYAAQSARDQLSFYALAWLIRTLPGGPLKFNSEGWMQTDSGKADVLSAFGSADYATLLMLDQKTHLPTEFESSFLAVRGLPVIVEGIALGPRNYYRMRELARQEAKAQAARPKQFIILKRRVSDYRRVSGILIPHLLVTSLDGKPVEELVITDVKVNLRLKPKDFEPNPRYKPAARQALAPATGRR